MTCVKINFNRQNSYCSNTRRIHSFFLWEYNLQEYPSLQTDSKVTLTASTHQMHLRVFARILFNLRSAEKIRIFNLGWEKSTDLSGTSLKCELFHIYFTPGTSLKCELFHIYFTPDTSFFKILEKGNPV